MAETQKWPETMGLADVADLLQDYLLESEETRERLAALTEIEHDIHGHFLTRQSMPRAFLQRLAQACPRLRRLDLHYTNISNLSSLSKISTLQELRLDNTQIIDLQPLADLAALQHLYLNNTQVSNLGPLAGLAALQELSLSNTQVSDLRSLSKLTALQKLRLDSTQVSDLRPLAGLTALKELYLNDTKVSNLRPLSELSALQKLRLDSTQVSDLRPLVGLKTLQYLSLHNTKVSDLPPLAGLTALQDLYLTFTQVSDLQPLAGLTALQDLYLDNTRVSDLRPLAELPALQELWLQDLHLASIPAFCFEREIHLHLNGTSVAQQPEALFRLPRQQILESYYQQLPVQINEGKVIFLGESGVGKTHTILRIEAHGAQKDYKTDSTPGVDIRPFDCGNGMIINFWDFGGQEIMQSMHSCFLTERSCYVVVVSNRDPGKTMPQARKWLRTVAGFSDQVSVLMAVNQWHNSSAESEIDSAELRKICPRLTDIVYYSAKDDSPEDFNRRLTEAILRQVRKLDSIQLELPQSWVAIREELLGMERDYITLGDYREACERHSLGGDDENIEAIRMWLLEWFNDMGVCFSYHKNAPQSAKELREYKVLRPAWLTNGIYRILNNGVNLSVSARLRREDVEALLNDTRYRAVDPSMKYQTEQERNYILEVMRKFHHSYYCPEEQVEFVPGVLPARRPEHVEPAGWGDPLIYTLKLTHLPISLLHRLMISMWKWQDGPLWRFGVRFQDGVSMLVVEANEEQALLCISLYQQDETYERFQDLFHEARGHILRDCREMRLVVEEETISRSKEGALARYELNALLEAYWETGGDRPTLPSQSGKFRWFRFSELLFPLFNPYILKVVPRLIDRTTWKDADVLNAVCAAYPFSTLETLQKLTKREIELLQKKSLQMKRRFTTDFSGAGFSDSENLENLALIVLHDRDFLGWLAENGVRSKRMGTRRPPDETERRITGVNSDLLEWARHSTLYGLAIGGVDSAQAWLKNALGPDPNDRYIDSVKLMGAVWAAHPRLGMGPDYKLLSAFEHSGAYYEKYRDHVTHMWKVFLLGLYLYEKHPTVGEAVRAVWNKDESFLEVWILTALWHDAGYLIENEDGTRDGPYTKKTLEQLNKALSLPLTRLFPKTFDAGLERAFQTVEDEAKQLIPPAKAEDLYALERKLACFEGFGQSLGLSTRDEGNPIKAYYDYMPLKRTNRTFYDHGIVSACMLLYVRDALCKYMSRCEGLELSESQWAKLADFLDYKEQYQTLALVAAQAVALHNLSKPAGDSDDARELNQRGVRIGQLCIPLQTEPIAYLLRLCDELQCWDRRRFDTPKEDEYSFTGDRLCFTTQIVNDVTKIVLDIRDTKVRQKVKNGLAGYLDPAGSDFLAE